MRSLLITTTLGGLVATTAGIGISLAGGGTGQVYNAWGHEFTYDLFRPQMLDVTVATEKSTGHKMNLVKLKNGHMMALVPADRYMALMTTPSDDMIR